MTEIGDLSQTAAPTSPVPGSLPGPAEAALREAAQALEAAFISEMLKQARFGEARDAFGGGAGEAQFASFLRDEHAKALSERGGFGLSEAIFRTLVARSAGPAT
ncbi:MAG: rod-binding protein [Pseudomonadota bacterium]